MTTITFEQAKVAQKQLIKELRSNSLTKDAGVGLTPIEHGFAISVHLLRPLPNGKEIVTRFEGVPVVTKVTGTIHAY